MKPLAGIRILAVEQFAAAPYGTLFLADLGAEVIKIENAAAGGDAARHGGPYLLGEADSLYFQGWNTGKRSVTLDLKTQLGRDAFQRLVRDADAVVNNLRGDQPAKLGLDFKSLSALNPRIVCAHISAYGRDNERASRPGYDFLMQAEAGLMSITGEPDQAPARFGPSVIDYMSGMTCMVGLLSCLIRAKNSGVGCDVDVSLYDVALHQLGYTATWYLNAGHRPTRLPRSSHFSAVPVQTFRASDGWVFVTCMTEKFWSLLADEVGRGDLKTDPRFATADARRAYRDELTGILDGAFQQASVAEWIERLGTKIPIGPVYDVPQALDSAFAGEVGMIASVPHPAMPDMRLLANPLKIDGERPRQAVCSALGADNAALLGGPG